MNVEGWIVWCGADDINERIRSTQWLYVFSVASTQISWGRGEMVSWGEGRWDCVCELIEGKRPKEKGE